MPQRKPVKLYTLRQIRIADFLGLSLGGALLVALNHSRTGNRKAARVAIAWGVAEATLLLVFVAFLTILPWAVILSPIPLALLMLLLWAQVEIVERIEPRSRAAGGVTEAAETSSTWAAVGIGLACSVALIGTLTIAEFNGWLAGPAKHYVASLTTEQRLKALTALPVDRPLDLHGEIGWMRCKAMTPTDSMPFDQVCGAPDSGLMMTAGMRGVLLSAVYVTQVGAESLDLAAWAREQFGAPSDSCAGDSAGLHFAVMWWNRPTVYITVAALSGPEHFRMHTFTLESRRFNEGPSCDRDAGPDLVRPKAPRRDRAEARRQLQELDAEQHGAASRSWPASRDSADVFPLADLDEQPVVISFSPPEYPDQLRQAGIQGRVIVECIIDTAGLPEPSSIRVVQSTNRGFNLAAVAALRRARFRPAREIGRAIRVQINVPIDFNLAPR